MCWWLFIFRVLDVVDCAEWVVRVVAVVADGLLNVFVVVEVDDLGVVFGSIDWCNGYFMLLFLVFDFGYGVAFVVCGRGVASIVLGLFVGWLLVGDGGGVYCL